MHVLQALLQGCNKEGRLCFHPQKCPLPLILFLACLNIPSAAEGDKGGQGGTLTTSRSCHKISRGRDCSQLLTTIRWQPNKRQLQVLPIKQPFQG